MTRTLILGASGQVGGALVQRLDTPANDIVTVSRHSVPLPARAGHLHIGADLTEAGTAAAVARAAPDIESAVLLASKIGGSTDVADAAAYFELETSSSLGVLSLLSRLRHVVYASSITVYGPNSALPVSETSALDPLNVYACAKLVGEDMLRALAAHADLAVTVLRISQMYGPRSPGTETVSAVCRRAGNGGPQYVTCGAEAFRDYVHESDVAHAIGSSLETRPMGTYNIGSGERTTVVSLVEAACRAAGGTAYPVVSSDNPTWSMVLDISKAREGLDYHPLHRPSGEILRRLTQD